MIFQRFNKRIGAYVKMKRCANGKVKVLDVKQKNKGMPFQLK